jgi:hypothetical protein
MLGRAILPPGVQNMPCSQIDLREPDTALLELYLAHGVKLEPDLLFYAVAPRVPQIEVMARVLLGRGVDPNGPFTGAGGRGVRLLGCAVALRCLEGEGGSGSCCWAEEVWEEGSGGGC